MANLVAQPGLDQDRLVRVLRALRGDALASFGGANGIELALACGSAESLAAQYQAVITKYKLQRIDFDIEGGAVSDGASSMWSASNSGLPIANTPVS